MNPFSSSKGQADWSGDTQDAINTWNQAVAGIQPSQGSINQVSQMNNQMTNDQYNQGLTASTMANQALGSGEMNAFQQDQTNQAKAAMGMMPMMAKGNMAAQMLPYQTLGQLFGMGAGAAEAFL